MTTGKMKLLYQMLQEIYGNSREKVVVVSNWTSTLDIIQEMLGKKKYPYLRLDGSTAQKTRQDLVDQFNRGRREDSFVFLLSAKAGGTGLNLIGYVSILGHS
jgi:DNA repair and recombination protein RAD54B